MRYQKGSISISTGQDIPVLRQVLESQFITHEQLFEFMRLRCYELNRHTFNWRVRRLVNNGFLDLHPVGHSCVYSMAATGVSLLAVTEQYCPVLTRKAHRDASSYDHSLELNELHLSLIRQGVLEDWKPEIAIRSKNELTEDGYAKDYDAIVTVRLVDRTASFALEYERTPKKPKEYLRIRSLLEQETRLRCILYVVPNNDLAAFILDCFAGTTVSLLVGFATEFGRSFTEMRVTDANSGTKKPVLLAL
jgi:hypothetical protein